MLVVLNKSRPARGRGRAARRAQAVAPEPRAAATRATPSCRSSRRSRGAGTIRVWIGSTQALRPRLVAAQTPRPAVRASLAAAAAIRRDGRARSRPAAAATSPRSPRRVRGYRTRRASGGRARRDAWSARAHAPAARRSAARRRAGLRGRGRGARPRRRALRSAVRRSARRARSGAAPRPRRLAGHASALPRRHAELRGARARDPRREPRGDARRARRCRRWRCRAATSWGELTRYLRRENLPGSFPFTAGVFPFKRENEDPTRMFAGEGDARAHQPTLPPAVRRASRPRGSRRPSTA